MQSTHGKLEVLLLDHYRHFDFRRRNHLDVDIFLGQGLEHAAGYAGMRTHAYADDGHLGDIRIADDLTSAHLGCNALQYLQRIVVVVAMHSEREVGGVIVRDVLHDHIHFNVRGADRTEDLERHPGRIRSDKHT